MNHWWREQRQWKNSCFVSLRTCTRNKGHSGRDDFFFLSLTPFGTKHVASPRTKKIKDHKKNYCFISPQKTNQTEPSPLHKQAFIKIKPDARHHAIAIICRPAHHVVNSLNVAATSSSQLARRDSSTASPRRALILSGIVHAVQEVLNVG